MAIDRTVLKRRFSDEFTRKGGAPGRSVRNQIAGLVNHIDGIDSILGNAAFTENAISVFIPMAMRDIQTATHIAAAVKSMARSTNSIDTTLKVFDELRAFEKDDPVMGFAAADVVLANLKRGSRISDLTQLLREDDSRRRMDEVAEFRRRDV